MWLRLFIFTIVLQSLLAAADGDLDISFGGDGKVITDLNGKNDWATSTAIQKDGKIVVAGYSYNGSNNDFALARYNTNGTPDTTFSGDGNIITDISGSDDVAKSVAIQSDGKIIVAGYTRNGGDMDFALARYNNYGTLDENFGTNGVVVTNLRAAADDYAFGIAIQDNDKIIVAGYSSNGSNNDFALVRYNPNGTLDKTFSHDGIVFTSWGTSDDRAYSVAIQSNGKIVLAGKSDINGNYDYATARYHPNGTLDAFFGSGGKVITYLGSWYDDCARSIAIQDNGKIIVAGYSYYGSDDDFSLVRYNPNGTLDTSFSGGGKVITDFYGYDDHAYSVILQNDGKIVLAGTSYLNGYDFALVRYSPNGTLDTSFGDYGKVITSVAAGVGNDFGDSATIQNDDKIIVVGRIHNGSDYDFALVRYGEASIVLAPIYYLLQ